MIFINEIKANWILPSYNGLKGEVECSVIDSKTKRVVRKYPKFKNLILNQGINNVLSRNPGGLGTCWAYCVAGTGTTNTSLSGSANTAAVASGTLTVSTTGYLAGTAADVGLTFLIGSQQYLVTAQISTTQATVTPAIDVSSSAFTLYYTNQTGLTTESKRTNTYLTDTGACGTNKNSSNVEMFRTFDFSAEVGNVGYNEIGLSGVSGAGANLFSRIKLPSTINLTSGQQLRVKYMLTLVPSPSTAQTIASSPITGWATASGVQILQSPFMNVINNVGSPSSSNTLPSGCTNFPARSGDQGYFDIIEPVAAAATTIALYSTSTLAEYWTANVLNKSTGLLISKVYALASYVNNTFYRDITTTFAVGEANFSTIREIRLGNIDSVYNRQPFQYVIDSNQTKDNLHTLTISIRQMIGRVL